METDKKQFLRYKLLKIKAKVLENIGDEYKGLKSLVELAALAAKEDEALATINGITIRYLEKFRGLYETLGKENQESILEEMYLIYKNNKNRLESLLLHALYKALTKVDFEPRDINENSSEFMILQKHFFNEIRKTYMECALSALRKKYNSKTSDNPY